MGVAIAVTVLGACASGDDSADTGEAASDMADRELAAVGDAGEDQAASPAAEDTAESGGTAAAPIGNATTFDLGNIGRDVIVEIDVVASSDDIARTVSAVSSTAAALGGGIAASDVNYGETATPGDDTDETTGDVNGDAVADGYARLVVKVPPDSVDRLLAGLADTAEVRSIDQRAQDVSEQLVDLDVRIANARRSVDSVREFMERATDLNDLVALESELTRRQTDLERLEAQRRNLSDRVALSTVTIEVYPSAAVPTSVDVADDGIGDAFARGWNAFVAVVFGVGFVLAVLSPFLALGALLAAIAMLVHRLSTRRPAPLVTARRDPSDVGSDEIGPADDELVSASREE